MLTEEQTREKLTQVQAALEEAIASLVRMRLSTRRIERDTLLSEAAAALEQVYRDWRCEKQQVNSLAFVWPEADLAKARTLLLLRGIQTRANQLQRLNDASVSLCRGWLSPAPASVDDYTPEGIWAHTHEAGGLRITG